MLVFAQGSYTASKIYNLKESAPRRARSDTMIEWLINSDRETADPRVCSSVGDCSLSVQHAFVKHFFHSLRDNLLFGGNCEALAGVHADSRNIY